MRIGEIFAFWAIARVVMRFPGGRAVVEEETPGSWRWEVVLDGQRVAGAGKRDDHAARAAARRALVTLQKPDKPWPKTKRRVLTSYMSPAPRPPAGHRWVRLDVRGDHLVRGEIGKTVCDKLLKVVGRQYRVSTIKAPGYPGACYTCNRASHDLANVNRKRNS